MNGTYIYIEASFPRQANDKARIISAGIPADGRMGHCVKFWFHMYGPHVNALNIYLKQGNQLNGPVWKRTGNNGNKWRYGQVSVSSNVAYSVRIFPFCQRYPCYISGTLNRKIERPIIVLCKGVLNLFRADVLASRNKPFDGQAWYISPLSNNVTLIFMDVVRVKVV